MGKGAPTGPRLPRKGTAQKRSREAIEGLAFQIGVMVAIERNRWKMNQAELAAKVGTDQIVISRLENGTPADMTNAKFDKLFKTLELNDAEVQCSFAKWWRDNG